MVYAKIDVIHHFYDIEYVTLLYKNGLNYSSFDNRYPNLLLTQIKFFAGKYFFCSTFNLLFK